VRNTPSDSAVPHCCGAPMLEVPPLDEHSEPYYRCRHCVKTLPEAATPVMSFGQGEFRSDVIAPSPASLVRRALQHFAIVDQAKKRVCSLEYRRLERIEAALEPQYVEQMRVSLLRNERATEMAGRKAGAA
jgi:hypothetical protein